MALTLVHDALLLFVTAALLVMAGIAVLNALTFPRLRASHRAPADTPLISPKLSLLIPARDEAPVIGATVRALLAQPDPNLEVIVLDDHSADGTAEVARQSVNGDPRLRVLAGEPLPLGWHGKNWACHQLAQVATGDWLIFTDADVRWSPGAVAALLDEATRTRADLLAVWPTQITVTWAERLVVPLVGFVIQAYLPALLVHHLSWASLAAANGQCLAFRRTAYHAVGGHAAVRASIVEDIQLARRIKRAGLRLRMADGNGFITCRMYDGWLAVRDGFAKNILAGYGDSVFALLLATLFHVLVFLAPWLWLVAGVVLPGVRGWPWAIAFTVALGLGIRALAAASTRQRQIDALALPVSVLLMTRIAAQAVGWRWRYGGPRWKGRTLNARLPDSETPRMVRRVDSGVDVDLEPEFD